MYYIIQPIKKNTKEDFQAAYLTTRRWHKNYVIKSVTTLYGNDDVLSTHFICLIHRSLPKNSIDGNPLEYPFKCKFTREKRSFSVDYGSAKTIPNEGILFILSYFYAKKRILLSSLQHT